MSCKEDYRGIKRIVNYIQVWQVRWRMTYGPMIKQGKFKEAIKHWKERHQR